MLEDDLRKFPMATTDYLQKIRESQRYQDIIAVDALLNVIVHACQAAESDKWTVHFVEVDWLDYRLELIVYDLNRGSWDSEIMEWMELQYGVITVNCVHAITPLRFGDCPSLIRLVQELRNVAECDSRGLSSVVSIIFTYGNVFVFTRVAEIFRSTR
jgi:hypothetical protein